jgi:hypothetical protein
MLIPYAKNARTHTDAQVAAIAASIREWGWTSPALVGEDGGLIAGHARILAARQLGIAEVPVMVAAGWSEAQKRAYVLADNQLAITGSGWDPELLRLELGEIGCLSPARWARQSDFCLTAIKGKPNAARRRKVGEDGGLIAGHARILAARQLGIAEVPGDPSCSLYGPSRNDCGSSPSDPLQ